MKPLNSQNRTRQTLICLASIGAIPLSGVMAQNNSSSDDRPAVPRTDQIDERARAAINTAKEAISAEDLKRDELIRSAQDRVSKMNERATAPTTITDKTPGGNTTLRALPTAPGKPGATATATANPSTPGATAAPLTPSTPATAKPASTLAASPAPIPKPEPLTVASAGAVPPPVPLRPRYRNTEKRSSDEAMEIESDEMIMDEKNNMSTFIGEVVVTSPTFLMKSDHLEVIMNDKENPQLGPDGKETPFQSAVATGSMVIIERIVLEGGKEVVEIAKSRRAVFDQVTGDTILTGGPPFLQRGEKVIRPEKENATIVLKNNGQHEVKGRSTVKFQVKGGAAANKGPALGGSLESIQNKR